MLMHASNFLRSSVVDCSEQEHTHNDVIKYSGPSLEVNYSTRSVMYHNAHRYSHVRPIHKTLVTYLLNLKD